MDDGRANGTPQVKSLRHRALLSRRRDSRNAAGDFLPSPGKKISRCPRKISDIKDAKDTRLLILAARARACVCVRDDPVLTKEKSFERRRKKKFLIEAVT